MMSTVEKIGRYEIVSELGRGAMGVVYRAVDPNIGRTVALKTMRVDVHGLQHDDLLRRFKYEARAAGLMNHSNIVTIYDADEVDGLFYIAMEYIEGDTLQSLLSEKRLLPAPQIVDITRQVTAGLDYAHHMKVIHRDIKPANIMLTPKNVAKLMDFGISKVAGNMTSGSQVLGTPNYMSPEQVRGQELDGRADLFSFGVVLYEMATGERPFNSDNVTTIIYKIIHEEPVPPSQLDITLHPGLSAVITKCLAKNPDYRYQTGAELARDMENYRSLGSEGEVTSKLPLETSVKASAPAGVSGPATAAFLPSSATQPTIRMAAAAAPAIASQNGKQASTVTVRSGAIPAAASQGAKRTAAVPPATRESKGKSGLLFVFMVLSVVAAAMVYGVRHRKHVALPSSPAQVTQQETLPTSATQSAPTPETSVPPAQPPEAQPAVVSAPETSAPGAPVKSAEKKPAEHVPEKAQPSGKVEVRFTSNPRGAFVQIDGKSSEEWLTPFTMADLTPGTHEVVFTKSGYSTERRSLEIGPKNSTYPIDLVPVTTALSVNSDPPGASIEIDGHDSGKITPAQIPVSEGDHKIVLRLDGYHTAQAFATVDAGQVFNFSPKLNPADARQAGNSNPVTARLGKFFGGGGMRGDKGMIDFVSNPPGARIFIQGRPMAFATPAHVPIPEGDYRIEFREDGYKPVAKNVHVEAGKGITVIVTLEPQ